MPAAPATTLSHQHRDTLLNLAGDALVYGLEHGEVLPIQNQQFDNTLQKKRASFVTLHKNKELRGCIGSLEARNALVEDVIKNAFAAGFQDPRFEPIQPSDLERLELHISILGSPELLPVDSEADLISQLRPNIDGLILQEGLQRGTFLPSVWETIPDPESFLRHLKAKAGLADNYWSASIQVFRYTTECFSRCNTR